MGTCPGVMGIPGNQFLAPRTPPLALLGPLGEVRPNRDLRAREAEPRVQFALRLEEGSQGGWHWLKVTQEPWLLATMGWACHGRPLVH